MRRTRKTDRCTLMLRGWLTAIKQQNRAIRRKNKLIKRLRFRIAHLEGGVPALQLALERQYVMIDSLLAERRLSSDTIARLRESLAEIREVWAGSDGLVPETCPEGYLQRLVKQCYQIATEALKR